MLLHAAVFVLRGQSIVSEPQVSLGTLRKEVPIDLRPRAKRDERAWSWIVKASGDGLVAATELDGVAKRIVAKPRPRGAVGDARDLLNEWANGGSADLLKRSRRLLEYYAPRSAALAKALTYPQWSLPRQSDGLVPKPEDMPATLFPQLSGLKEMTPVLLLQAQVDLADGRPKDAERHLMMARAVGERLCAAGSNLVTYLVGISCEAIADTAYLKMAQRKALPSETMVHLARHLQRSTARADLAGSLRGELDTFPLHFIASFGDPSRLVDLPEPDREQWKVLLAGHPKPFDRLGSVRLASEVFRVRIVNATCPWGQQANVEREVEKWVAPLPEWLRTWGDEEPRHPTREEIASVKVALIAVPNPLGRAMVAGLASSGAEEAKAAFRTEARQLGTALALASIAYRDRTRVWPSSLKDLRPGDGIDAMPLDPFSRKPFVYDSRRLTISSIGPSNAPRDRKALTFPLAKPAKP